MTATLTPLPAGTDVAETIGGKAHSRTLIMDPSGADAVGLVTASPAPYTLLGRLFAVATAIGNLAAQLPVSLGVKAASGSLSIVPATSATFALGALNGAAVEAKQDALIAVGTETYALAANISLAAGAAGPTVTVPRGGYFFFDAAFTGTSPSLKLQRLGADNTTWIDVVTRTAIGSGDPVGIPNGSQLRVLNAGTNAMTAVSADLG